MIINLPIYIESKITVLKIKISKIFYGGQVVASEPQTFVHKSIWANQHIIV